MKIIVISNSDESSLGVRKVLESFGDLDQIQNLARIDSALRFDRVDLASAEVVIIDAEQVSEQDIRSIASIEQAHPHLSVIYLCNSSTHDELVQLIRAGVADVLHKPLHNNEFKLALDRIRDKKFNTGRRISKVISFISCKGGAGASFLATNFAYILAKECNKRVLFIDLHMQGGDAAFYLTNIQGGSTIVDIAKHSDLDAMMISSASILVEDNFYLLPSADSPEKAVGLNAGHIDNLISVASKDYDFVIIDMPHVLDGITIKALDRSDQIFLVTQPIMTYLKAVSLILNLFTRLEYEDSKVRVLLNRMDNVGVLSVARVEGSIQKNIAATVPNDFLNAVEAVNTGVAIAKVSPRSPISESLRMLAQELCGIGGTTTKAVEKKSFLKKILYK